MKRIFLLPVFALLLASCGDSSGPGASTANFCEAMVSFSSLDAAFETTDLSPESIEVTFETVEAQVEAAAKVAPAEIKEDMEALSDGISLFVELLRDVDFDFFGLGEEAAALDDPELDAAGERVNEFVRIECGIDLDDDTSADFSSEENPDSTEIPAGDNSGTVNLEGDFDTLPGEVQATIVASLVEVLGISPESVECLIQSAEVLDAEVLDAEGLTEELLGADAFAILEKCGLDLSDFGSGITGLDSDGVGDNSVDEGFGDLAIQMMADLWQTEPANVECLMTELGVSDPLEISAGSVGFDILEQAANCGIDLESIGFGS